MSQDKTAFHCVVRLGQPGANAPIGPSPQLELPAESFSAEFYSYSGNDRISTKIDMYGVQDLIALSQNVIPLPIQLWAGFPGTVGSTNGLALVFDGIVDEIKADYTTGYYEVSGRSWAYPLVNSKTPATFKGMKDGAVVQSLCAAVGLAYSDGGTPATNDAGKLLGKDFVLDGRNIRKWDLIVNLAKGAKRQVYVVGKTLYYVVALPDSQRVKRSLTWRQNLKKLEASHYAQFSHDIHVTVKNWHPGKKQQTNGVHNNTVARGRHRNRFAGPNAPKPSITPGRKAGATSTRLAAGSVSTNENIVIHTTGGNQAQADAQAEAVWEEASRHEIIVTATIDGDPGLSIHDLFGVFGVGSVVSQNYHAKTLRHYYGDGEGYLCDLDLVNRLPDTTGLAL